jgi:hypothetical protein
MTIGHALSDPRINGRTFLTDRTIAEISSGRELSAALSDPTRAQAEGRC